MTTAIIVDFYLIFNYFFAFVFFYFHENTDKQSPYVTYDIKNDNLLIVRFPQKATNRALNHCCIIWLIPETIVT